MIIRINDIKGNKRILANILTKILPKFEEVELIQESSTKKEDCFKISEFNIKLFIKKEESGAYTGEYNAEKWFVDNTLNWKRKVIK